MEKGPLLRDVSWVSVSRKLGVAAVSWVLSLALLLFVHSHWHLHEFKYGELAAFATEGIALVAVGLVLQQLITGEPPFTLNSLAVMLTIPLNFGLMEALHHEGGELLLLVFVILGWAWSDEMHYLESSEAK